MLEMLFYKKTSNRHYCRGLEVCQYARGESNPNRRNRNPIFYPLNYARNFEFSVGKSNKELLVLQNKAAYYGCQDRRKLEKGAATGV